MSVECVCTDAHLDTLLNVLTLKSQKFMSLEAGFPYTSVLIKLLGGFDSSRSYGFFETKVRFKTPKQLWLNKYPPKKYHKKKSKKTMMSWLTNKTVNLCP